MDRIYTPQDVLEGFQQGKLFREDIEDIIDGGKLKCPDCGGTVSEKESRYGWGNYLGCDNKICSFTTTAKALFGLQKKHCPTCKCADMNGS